MKWVSCCVYWHGPLTASSTLLTSGICLPNKHTPSLCHFRSPACSWWGKIIIILGTSTIFTGRFSGVSINETENNEHGVPIRDTPGRIQYLSDVIWASRCLKPLPVRLFVQQLVQADSYENVKASLYCYFKSEFTRDRWTGGVFSQRASNAINISM